MGKIWRFGMLGTLFSIIVVYFIYKYAQAQQWTILEWLAWIYLLIWVIVIGIAVLVIVFTLLILFINIIWVYLKYRWMKKKSNKHPKTIDAEYQIKQE